MLSAEEGADKTAQRRERQRERERERETERDKFERANQRRFFLGYERNCRHISARIDTRDFKKRTPEKFVFLAFGFFSRIVASAAKNTHK